MSERQEQRQPFLLRIDLSTGAATLERKRFPEAHLPSHREGASFLRAYTPTVRCLIIGSSPIGVALSELAACAGFEAEFYAPDLEILPALPNTVKLRSLMPRSSFATDPWTAAILAFHDHDQEMPVFSELLRSPCFFIGAIGSRNAHTARKIALAEAGFTQAEIARIASPAGLVAGLKNAPFVGLSILMQIVATARDKRIVS